jgi:ribonuclease D
MSRDSAGVAPVVEPIVDMEDARRVVARLGTASTLALDTEGDGMFRYRTRLCTMQLAADGEVHVCDTLAFEPAPLFCELLGARGPEKIVHDVSFDARVLFAHGIVLDRVFDTSIAARFLSLKSTGLSSLLAQWFQIDLPKHKQQADWGERPLDEEALSYLADDVRHLAALHDVLLAEVRKKGIEDEVREECAYMLAEARVPVRELAPWMRIKGAIVKAPKERARLAEIAKERELIAQELDVPPTRLLANELVLRLCELEDESAFLAKLPTRFDGHADRLWSSSLRGAEQGDAPEDEVRELSPRPPSPAELERKKRRRKLLTEWRTREAARREVDPQVVLPGHCLSDMVDLPLLSKENMTTIHGFGSSRVARYGDELVAELTRAW